VEQAFCCRIASNTLTLPPPPDSPKTVTLPVATKAAMLSRTQRSRDEIKHAPLPNASSRLRRCRRGAKIRNIPDDGDADHNNVAVAAPNWRRRYGAVTRAIGEGPPCSHTMTGRVPPSDPGVHRLGSGISFPRRVSALGSQALPRSTPRQCQPRRISSLATRRSSARWLRRPKPVLARVERRRAHPEGVDVIVETNPAFPETVSTIGPMPVAAAEMSLPCCSLSALD